MTHIDYFIKFFQEKKRGEVKDICQYLVDNCANFNCAPERRCVSVNRHISRECGKQYPTGIVCREINVNGNYEYFIIA